MMARLLSSVDVLTENEERATLDCEGEKGGPPREILRAMRGKRISRRTSPHPTHKPPLGRRLGVEIYTFKTSLHIGVVVGVVWFGFLIDLGGLGTFNFGSICGSARR